MASEPNWITADEVIRINFLQVQMTGEPHGILRREGLDGAIARPRQLFAYGTNPDILDMGLALLFGIAQSHAFIQGNKRTAFEAAVQLIERNGYIVTAPNMALIADMIIDVIAGRSSEEIFRLTMSRFIEPA